MTIPFDVNLEAIEPDFKFYYDCLMGAKCSLFIECNEENERFWAKLKLLPTVTGHYFTTTWIPSESVIKVGVKKQAKTETIIGLYYVSEYGYSDRLAQSIGHGIQKTGVGVEMLDLATTDSPRNSRIGR